MRHASRSVTETESIAAEFARTLRGGECIALHGEMGAGKTHFVRGLLRGLDGVERSVSSPTYVLLNVYDTGRLKVFPAATFVLGETQAYATEKARHIRLQQVGPQTAIAMLEQVWQRDLSGYDPDGPLPDVEPADDPTITQGRVRHGDPKAVAASWRERAQAEKLSIRELVIAVTSRQQFVGTPAQVADEIDLHIQADACDGFILVPHLTPHGLDEFVDRVVPLLQERGAFRTEYTGHTLRDHLCL